MTSTDIDTRTKATAIYGEEDGLRSWKNVWPAMKSATSLAIECRYGLNDAARGDVSRTLRRVRNQRHAPGVAMTPLQRDPVVRDTECMPAGLDRRSERPLEQRLLSVLLYDRQIHARLGPLSEVPPEGRLLL